MDGLIASLGMDMYEPWVLPGLCAVAVGVVSSLVLIWRKPSDGTPRAAADNGGGGASAAEPEDMSAYPGGRLSLFFGSQTGTAEGFARTLAEEGLRNGFKTVVNDLEDFDPELLMATEKAVFLMATYGEGEPTDNASRFAAWLADEGAALEGGVGEGQELPLAGLKFCVFGLGNRQYEQYNRMGKTTDAGLEALGGERIFPRGEGDDDGTLEDDFDAWKESLWPALSKLFHPTMPGGVGSGDNAPQALHVPFQVRFLEGGGKGTKPVPESAAASSTRFFWQGKEVAVEVNRELRGDGAGTSAGSTRHVELDLIGTGLSYQTADNLAVLPENAPEMVERLCRRLGYDPDAAFALDMKEGEKPAFPTPCTVRTALSRFLDVMSVPRRGLVERLVRYVDASSRESQDLARLSSRQDKSAYHGEVEAAGLVLAELICDRYPSLEWNIPLADFLHLCPKLHPRYYTISSSPSVVPGSVHITVSVLEQARSGGRVFRGVCSNYIQSLQAPGAAAMTNGKSKNGARKHGGGAPLCRVFVRPSSFRLPASPETPVVLVGPGTGVAPMRALLQERMHQRKVLGHKVGPTVLYFGCRRRSEDYIYRQELEGFLEDGTLDALRVAFSREQGEKVYVQHRLAEHGEETWDMLGRKGAHIYICGGTSMGADVQEEVSTIARTQGGMTADGAKAFIQALHAEGRYVQELWS